VQLRALKPALPTLRYLDVIEALKSRDAAACIRALHHYFDSAGGGAAAGGAAGAPPGAAAAAVAAAAGEAAKGESVFRFGVHLQLRISRRDPRHIMMPASKERQMPLQPLAQS
jgi:hypothetical protein